MFNLGYDVGYGNELWVAGGGTTGRVIATSSNGKSWTLSSTTIFDISGSSYVLSMCWNGSLWVGASTNFSNISKLGYSSDGSNNWISATTTTIPDITVVKSIA